MQLDAERRRAEADKEAVMSELVDREKQIVAEKEEKKRLEEKIRMMHSQILTGGKTLEELPQFRSALEEKQRIIR